MKSDAGVRDTLHPPARSRSSMAYLAHTAHPQLKAFWFSSSGWILTAVALGLIQWRVWQVSDTEVVTSGQAWVGIWRACFPTNTEVSPGYVILHCRSMGLTEDFTPPEVAAGQVLMLLSLILGLCGNAGAIYSLRKALFGMERRPPIRLTFLATGALCLLAAIMSLVPLLWNLVSVVTNQTINFPPEFRLPQAPDYQYLGPGIWVGMVGSALMVLSGIIFCFYRKLTGPHPRDPPGTKKALTGSGGRENPGFELDQKVSLEV
ncbi:uncharacterized protein V6R79_014906 [Siganus canaliculatus]